MKETLFSILSVTEPTVRTITAWKKTHRTEGESGQPKGLGVHFWCSLLVPLRASSRKSRREADPLFFLSV